MFSHIVFDKYIKMLFWSTFTVEKIIIWVHLPCNTMKSSNTLSRETAPEHNVSTSVSHSQHFSSSKHDKLSWCQRAQFWSNLTTALSPKPSRNHLNVHWQTSDGPLYMCLLEQGILIHCGIVRNQWFTWWLLSQIALRSLISTTRVFLGWSLTFLMMIIWDLAWRSRPRVIHGYFVFLTFPNNGTNSCLLLTKLLADGLVAHFSLVQVYNLVPEVIWQLFGLAHGGGNVGMEDTDSVDRFLSYI